VGHLIIGCGNAERGDDAAGLLAARRLREMGIETREHDGEGLSLLEEWNGAARVILIDAVVTGAAAGTISMWDARAAPVRREAFPVSTHAFGVAEAVEMGRMLGRLPESLVIYGIEAEQFERGAQPGAAVLEAVERVAQRIAQEAKECTNPA
jgi:hydrogenase maturation protease